MKMKKSILLLVAFGLVLFSEASGQDSLRFSRKPNQRVETFLEGIRVKDVSRQLGDKERHEMCRLFVRSYVVAKREYLQDQLLNPGTPIYKLFKANFPPVAQREGDGGIFLGEITRFINSMPEYRTDVDQVLREGGRVKKRCQESSNSARNQ